MPGSYPVALAARRARQREQLAAPLALAQELRSKGRTLARIAQELNAEGHTAPNGGAFKPNSVLRLLALTDEV